MSGQDVGFFDVGADCLDLVIEDGDLKADDSLENAALITAFSNVRVEIRDLPPGITDQEGWWADDIADIITDQIGSRLWTVLRRGKILDSTIAELETIMIEAFNWMKEDGIAVSITAEAERIATDRVEVTVEITRPDGDNIPFKFVWDGQILKLIRSTT